MVRNRTGQFSKSSVDSRKQRARERASKLNQKHVVVCDRAKVENKVEKFQGCRIIDLKYLISQLEDGCSLCGEVLHLVNLEDETRHGLASFFTSSGLVETSWQCIQANITEIWRLKKKKKKMLHYIGLVQVLL